MLNILGINISQLKKTKVIEKIDSYLKSDNSHYIITPNPEIILKAIGKDEEYFHVLNQANISIADGFGIKLAGWLKLENTPRITGAGLVLEILSLLEDSKKKVLVLNWENGLSTSLEIEKFIKKKYKNLKLKVINCDKLGKNLNYDEINKFSADFLFVNFGAPFQEKFIFHNKNKFNNLKCAIGVGGAFDFLTGKIKRAPKILRLLGLEWLWRLLLQPKRYKRILNATVVFFYKFLLWHFITPHFYRPNVVCMTYKKDEERFKILIVKRSDLENHWQLPQGGTDGENLENAGIRELNEELNSDKFIFKKSFKNLHKYLFDNSRNGTTGIKSGFITGYKGQKQGLIIAKFTGNDSEIKVNFFEHSKWAWVEDSNLIEKVHECRKKSAKIFIEKFNKIKTEL
jgi:N-acetylglucosaminyldiphosphoundecaprenol N-acetyl-beta-D-mannosaminyltransferase